jgi:hypothetical protein
MYHDVNNNKKCSWAPSAAQHALCTSACGNKWCPPEWSFIPHGASLQWNHPCRTDCATHFSACPVLVWCNQVLGWEAAPGDTGVTVVTDKGSYSADKLVLTGGAWMHKLVPELQVHWGG